MILASLDHVPHVVAGEVIGQMGRIIVCVPAGSDEAAVWAVASPAVGAALLGSGHCASRPEWVRPRSPVPAWAPHDLRRTVRTQPAAMGCPSDVAEAVLGHLQPGIEETYNRHRYDVERREWIGRLAAEWEVATAAR